MVAVAGHGWLGHDAAAIVVDHRWQRQSTNGCRKSGVRWKSKTMLINWCEGDVIVARMRKLRNIILRCRESAVVLGIQLTHYDIIHLCIVLASL